MLEHDVFALVTMSSILIVIGVLIPGVLLNKKHTMKAKTFYMGIIAFAIIAILVAFFYLVPVNSE